MLSSTAHIYIVRHGETLDNALGKIQGSSNISPDNELNEAGINQAKSAAAKLNTISFECRFTSDLKRAQQTLEIITDQNYKIDPRIRERDWKVWEKRTMEEFNVNPDLHWTQVESDSEVRDRGVAFLNEIGKSCLGKTILVVGHGGWMRNVLIRIFNLDCKVEDIKVGNAAYYKLEYCNNEWKMGKENDGIRIPETAFPK
ncbi:MAG: histidine phosphatase family protein [Candidatus Protochlamydia sp.]|nr:histidine phosphatase family protein [Candidatus Protochlamydia sp.]